jgi:hypothetical protein
LKEQLEKLRKKTKAELALEKALEERGLKKGDKPKKKLRIKNR